MPVRWKCPICKRDTEPLSPQFPFCSERCRNQDLANWATEAYVIPTPMQPTDEDALAHIAGLDRLDRLQVHDEILDLLDKAFDDEGNPI